MARGVRLGPQLRSRHSGVRVPSYSQAARATTYSQSVMPAQITSTSHYSNKGSDHMCYRRQGLALEQ